ncbi:polysaccharide deacetylase family protein [Streptacidiphilus monticola]
MDHGHDRGGRAAGADRLRQCRRRSHLGGQPQNRFPVREFGRRPGAVGGGGQGGATPSPTPRATSGDIAPSGGNAAVDPRIEYTIAHAPGEKNIALTFDDGPSPQWTPKILALLAQYHAHATFCQIGPNAQAHPELVKQIIAAGDRLCDHTVSHNEQMSRTSVQNQTREILDARTMIETAGGPGTQVGWFRAPGGDFSPVNRHIAAAAGLRPLGWSADSEDWKRPGVPRIVHNVLAQLRPGAIVLMHDGGGNRGQTVAALAQLLPKLVAQGYTFDFLDK